MSSRDDHQICANTPKDTKNVIPKTPAKHDQRGKILCLACGGACSMGCVDHKFELDEFGAGPPKWK
jgi:ferredoxin